MDRALSRGLGASHRMYLIERKDLAPPGSDGGAKATFVVLGATKNVYEVTIGKHMRCSCPDAAKGNVCKHQLFVMLRVLKLDKENPAVWQRALLTAEVCTIRRRLLCPGSLQLHTLHHAVLDFDAGRACLQQRGGLQADEALASQSACDQDALVSKHYKAKYKRATGGTSADAEADVGKPEGDCPICYEDMADTDEATEACTTCKHHVHKACMRTWMSRKDQAHQLACVLCRAPWTNSEGAEPPCPLPSSFRSTVTIATWKPVALV